VELIAYISLIFISVINLITESKFIYKYLFIPSVIVFLYIVRTQGFDSDIEHYEIAMRATSYDLYYLREFVFWFGLRSLYFIFSNELVTFLFLDMIWIYCMIKIGNRIDNFPDRLSKSFLLVIITSFPFVFGFENIYRQFYATVFALLSYSMIKKNYYRSLFIFIISFFMHNIVAILLPIFIVKKFYKFNFSDRIIISLIISLLFVASLGLLVKLKSVEKTGVEMGVFYLMIFVLFLIMSLLFFRKNIYKLFEKVPSLFFIVVLMLGLITLDADMIAERLGMMFICFLMYDLYEYSSEISNKNIRSLLRISLLLLFSLPTLFFESSRQFLL
tara:strand:- start:14075 stop:15067 length:993 start_codon:yes stop_codon:yes gene_type:complete